MLEWVRPLLLLLLLLLPLPLLPLLPPLPYGKCSVIFDSRLGLNLTHEQPLHLAQHMQLR